MTESNLDSCYEFETLILRRLVNVKKKTPKRQHTPKKDLPKQVRKHSIKKLPVILFQKTLEQRFVSHFVLENTETKKLLVINRGQKQSDERYNTYV